MGTEMESLTGWCEGCEQVVDLLRAHSCVGGLRNGPQRSNDATGETSEFLPIAPRGIGPLSCGKRILQTG